MFIAVMGVNHRSAPVHFRERMSFSENKIKRAFPELLAFPGIAGCCILSTCNRTEIYVASTEWEMGRKAVRAFWAKSSGLAHTDISKYTFCYTLEEAVCHLFRVTAGLDSMVLGETEILGQVKRAYMTAHEAGATNAALNTLFQQALSTAKRARSETGIDRNPVSVPSVAVELIKRELAGQSAGRQEINGDEVGGQGLAELNGRDVGRDVGGDVGGNVGGDVGGNVGGNVGGGDGGGDGVRAGLRMPKDSPGPLAGRTVLVIGAGKMSELTLMHLKASGISGIVVSNRSYDRAMELAHSLGGRAVLFDDILDALTEADIVISGTAAQHIVLNADTVARAMARRPEKPLLLVDIAVPRDIDPEVKALSGVTLFDVDDLQHVVDRHWQVRQQAASQGEMIIQEDCEAFMERLAMSSVNPVLRSLQDFGDEIKEQELKRALSKLRNLSPRERTAVETLATAITNKIMLQPLLTLRQAALSSEGHFYTQLTQKLFGLEGADEDEEQFRGRKQEECVGSVANTVGYRMPEGKLSSVQF
ncbi:MAG: glutamyl-tRNA reductase [Peptococcaceae bacterium]|nr:glutamyl-tRNA reductase [Peptococcaceae bacterium]